MVKEIILASKSGVRKKILEENNIQCKIEPSNVDEDSIKEKENTSYKDISKIEKEINQAKKTFIKYKWPTIDVTRKSVEETAASIIKIYEINKNNG